jgi:hypothetical protein
VRRGGRGKKELVRLEREEVLLLRRIAGAVEQLVSLAGGGMTGEEQARLDAARAALQGSAEGLQAAVNNQPKET